MSKRKPAPGTDAVLDSISDGVFTVDGEWKITSFNRAAERITGVPRAEALGRACCEVFRASICERDCALRQTMETGEPVVGRTTTILAADGRQVPISVSTALLRDGRGRVIGGAETFRDLSALEALRNELRGVQSIEDIVARSHAMRQVMAVLPRIAESGSTCLIEGESGTGKELVARALHRMSPRADKPFVAVNCGALPDTLLESELFGYVAGAFTDARRDKPGRFAAAEEGSLFLDEIGDVSPALQVKLLRVLQEREYQPLGAESTVKADVRLIAATNRDLDELVASGSFRQDLFYRVNVVRVRVPPLRDRPEDIPVLAEHFVRRFNLRQQREVAGLDRAALKLLMAHRWPGNVRELENAIEHAFVLCPGGLVLPDHLPTQLRGEGPRTEDTGVITLAEAEERAIRQALLRNDGNRRETARELGIAPSTLWRKLKKLGPGTTERT
jgi:PAS domain S-box-containing protein